MLRRGGRRGFLRRSVFVGALAGMLLLAPARQRPPPIDHRRSSSALRLGLNGWYKSNVTVNWQVDGETSLRRGCDAKTFTRTRRERLHLLGETTGRVTAVKSARSRSTRPPSGSHGARTRGRRERLVQPAAHRRLHRNGRDLGIAHCTSGRYAGPDSAALVAGSCTDNAGNRPRLVLVQVRRHPAEHLRGDRNAREPERADLVAEVQRHEGHRGLQNAWPERTGRVRDLPRHSATASRTPAWSSVASTSTE